MQPGSRMSMQSGSGGHLVSRGCKLLGGRLLSPLNVALGLGSEILELCQIRRLMKGAIRRAQRHSEALRGTQRHSEALRGTQRHSEALRGTQRHSDAIRRTRTRAQRQSEPCQCPLATSVPPRHAYLGHQFGLETAAQVIQSTLSGSTGLDGRGHIPRALCLRVGRARRCERLSCEGL